MINQGEILTGLHFDWQLPEPVGARSSTPWLSPERSSENLSALSFSLSFFPLLKTLSSPHHLSLSPFFSFSSL